MIFFAKSLKAAKYCLQIIKLKSGKGKTYFLMSIMLGLFRESKALIAMLLPALILQLVINKRQMDILLVVILGVCLLTVIISTLIEFLQRSISNHSIRALNYAILSLNQKSMRIDLDKVTTSDMLGRFDKAYDGLWSCNDVDFTVLSVLLSKTVSLAVTAYIFSTVHWSVAILVVATLIVELILSGRLNDKLYKHNQEQAELTHKKDYISQTMLDCRTNKEIFLNGDQVKEFFISKFRKVFDKELEIEEAKKTDLLVNDRQAAAIELLRTGFVYIIAIMRYAKGLLPIANFILFSSAAKQMTYAIWQIFQSLNYLLNAANYFEDYESYMRCEEGLSKEGTQKLDKEIAFIEFKNVYYQYPNQTDCAVKNLSFTIQKGESIAFVGDNGAGKSTVVKLIMQLYHVTSGEILLNGNSIYSYDSADYLSHFGPVFQDYMLYALSIRENLLFDRKMDDESLTDILQQVELGEKLHSLPYGLNTDYTKRFSEDGVEFSGGEEQKLVIARGIAKSGEIMVLDEPTAAIDPISEHHIYSLILGLSKTHTTIFVSHRMSTTRFCNKILVFNNGTLAECGTHSELMGMGGLYSNMFKMQTTYYKE